MAVMHERINEETKKRLEAELEALLKEKEEKLSEDKAELNAELESIKKNKAVLEKKITEGPLNVSGKTVQEFEKLFAQEEVCMHRIEDFAEWTKWIEGNYARLASAMKANFMYKSKKPEVVTISSVSKNKVTVLHEEKEYDMPLSDFGAYKPQQGDELEVFFAGNRPLLAIYSGLCKLDEQDMSKGISIKLAGAAYPCEINVKDFIPRDMYGIDVSDELIDWVKSKLAEHKPVSHIDSLVQNQFNGVSIDRSSSQIRGQFKDILLDIFSVNGRMYFSQYHKGTRMSYPYSGTFCDLIEIFKMIKAEIDKPKA